MSTIYTRLTGQAHGELTRKTAEIKVYRSSPIVQNSLGWDVGIKRLIIKNVKLPLFDPSQYPATVYFKNISTSVVTAQVVDFTPHSDTDGYIYDYQDVGDSITDAFAALCVTLSITAPDIPTFTFDSGSLKFAVNTTAAFRAAYKIAFDTDLYSYMPSFDYESVFSSPYYVDIANGGDKTEQYTSTIELLSPVASIAIKSDLPAANDLLPPPFNKPNSIATSYDEAKFLVDFDVQQTNNQAENLIRYNAKLNEVEWRNITSNNDITNFYLRFYWIDYKNNSNLLYLEKNSIITSKIIFRLVQ